MRRAAGILVLAVLALTLPAAAADPIPPMAPATFSASMTAAICSRTATAPAPSQRSNTGYPGGVTSDSNLLQSTTRCAHPPLSHGRTRFLYREGRNQEDQAPLPELPWRIRVSRPLEGLPQEKGTAARRR